MTEYEINQKIVQLQQNITTAGNKISNAEENIRQLTALKNSCSEYQTAFESSRTTRKVKMNHFNKITGQSKLVGTYGDILEDVLDGAEYTSTYGDLDAAKVYIDQEIQKQKQVINECNCEIAGFNSSISYWKQQLKSE